MREEKLRNLIQREIEAIQNAPIDGVIFNAVDLIYEQVHQKDGKVVVSGIGKAGQIGLNIATTLSSTGTPAVFMHAADAIHGDLGLILKDDAFLEICTEISNFDSFV